MRPVAILGVIAAALGLFAPATALARRAGIAAAGCDGCHRGGRPATVTLLANPPAPAVGTPTTLTVSVSATNGNAAGFFLTVDGDNNGAFRALESGTLATKDAVTHTMTRTGSGGAITFKAEWTASKITGVDFVVYALSANGDGTSGGDGGGEVRLSTVSGCTGTTYYLDQDNDGYGTADAAYPTRQDCVRPQSYAPVAGDCDDFNANVHPGGAESCDGKDNDCNGKVDDAVVFTTYCEDKDGDGHGVTSGVSKSDCAPSAGFGDCKGDCNDTVKTEYPGAPEVCDGRDNNCDGRIDEGVRLTCGKGWCARYAEGCTTACTPGPPNVEFCNYYDDDCDGVVDNGTDAELCGASGMACVLGQCIADPASGTGGASGSAGGSAGAGTGGRGGSGGGSPAMGGAGGVAGGGAGAGGCALVGRLPRGSAAGALLLALAGCAMTRRRPVISTRCGRRLPRQGRDRLR